ncbi:ABC transporter substrate binding protein [Maridesulfovibrio sp.]|uniref:ABC transporter substrate-binding protein n=1 Tax=Maridesulfovibrio sp. TaxID=2795000 RepID=UPI002A18CB91|nr:ABC transporter substrate binding protein [Maridesulfovibrio sp.]
MVNSYNRDFKWVKEHNGILKRGLAGEADVICYYLDFKRLSKDQAERNVEDVKRVLAERRPEVVVLTDDYALKSLGQFLVDLDIPVVFLGVNGNARGYVNNVRKITGVFERPLVKRSVAYLTEIIGPGKFLVLMDDSLSSRVFVQESLGGNQSFNVSGTHADILLIQNFLDWQEKVKGAQAAGYTCIIIGTYHVFKDEQGKHISSADVIRWTSKYATVPVFALWDFSVGQGMAVGGYVLSGVDQGREALKMVKRILSGEKTENIPPVIGKRGQLLFSGPEMKRWNVTIPRSLSSKGFQIKIIR